MLATVEAPMPVGIHCPRRELPTNLVKVVAANTGRSNATTTAKMTPSKHGLRVCGVSLRGAQ